MSRVTGVRLGSELDTKLQQVCEGLQVGRSQAVRLMLRAVQVDEVVRAWRESRPEQAEHEAS
jgi:antitoxin component of RelBE/YafQ-DinJ toxin-antitoxin module